MGKQNNYTDAERLTARVMRHLNAQEADSKGDLNMVARHIAMAYQLFTAANAHAEEANEILARNGLTIGKMKTVQNNLMQSFDAYDKVFTVMLHGDGEAWAQVCQDNELLTEVVDALMKNNVEVVRGPYFGAKLFLPEKQR